MLMIASLLSSLHRGGGESAAALSGLQLCLASVHSWMPTNKLKLNPDETEFLLVMNKQQRKKHLSMYPIEPFGVKKPPAKPAPNLGSNN